MPRLRVPLLQDEREALIELAHHARCAMRDQATLAISHESTDCDWMNLVRLQRAFCLEKWWSFALHI